MVDTTDGAGKVKPPPRDVGGGGPPQDDDGLMVLRGRLIGYSQWMPTNADEEHLDAVIAVRCPLCYAPFGRQAVHFHEWDLRDGVGVASRRTSHHSDPLVARICTAYRVALDPTAEHAVAVGIRPTRPRRRQLADGVR